MKSKVRLFLLFISFALLAIQACALPSLFTSKGETVFEREAQRTETPHECDLTQYLGVSIEITNQNTLYGDIICDFQLNFENQHPTETGIPVVQTFYSDCYADKSEVEWMVLDNAAPGASTPWFGYDHFYFDPECADGRVFEIVTMAALIKESEYCRSLVTKGSTLYSEEFFMNIANQVNLRCPSGQ